jgi:hypothetical protein
MNPAGAGDVIALVLAMPGVFVMLIFLALMSLYVLFTTKTVVSGVILSVSGAAYAAVGIWTLATFSSDVVHMLSFVLLIFGLGQAAFGIDLFLSFRKKKTSIA